MVITGFLVWLAASLPAAAQAQGAKPETATDKPATEKSKPTPQAPRRDRTPQKRDAAGEERPRLDVPVSFPVDI